LATVVRNDVNQLEPKTSRIIQGDDVIRDEVIRTNANSDAKFVLKDDTNLILGPNSSLKLDRAVFSGESTAGDIAIKLSSGAFRFVTGKSTKESYAIHTPLATIGVRGTILDIKLERLRNLVVLKEGMANVCAGANCIVLKQYGDTAIITSANGKVDISMSSSSGWTFDSACNGGLCNHTTFAQAENSLTTGNIGTGGRGGGGGGGGGGTTAAIAAGGQFSGGSGGSTAPSFTPNSSQNLLLGGTAGGASASPQSETFP
jgi:hypothetical protein